MSAPFRLAPDESIVTVYAAAASGPGWSNRPLWVIVRARDGALREECIQPEDQSAEILALYDVATAAHRAMLVAVLRTVWKVLVLAAVAMAVLTSGGSGEKVTVPRRSDAQRRVNQALADAALERRLAAAGRLPPVRETTPTLTREQLNEEYRIAGVPTAPPRQHNERDIHKAIVAWYTLCVPRNAALIFHVPSGEDRSPITGALLRAMGTVAGIPDLILFLPGGRVACAEIKAPGGRQSPAQRDVEGRCLALGVPYALVQSVEEFASSLRAWGVAVRAHA